MTGRGLDALLLASSFGLGLRHGVDWDHLVAIGDLTGTEVARGRTARLAVFYALGHGLSVFVIGALAIAAGERLPDWTDAAMERLVGATLLILAVVLLVSARKNRRPVSRGVALLDALSRVRQRFRRRTRSVVAHDHPHLHDHRHGHDHPEAADAGANPVVTAHRHAHVHVVETDRYNLAGAGLVGVLHGVGAETGTQAIVLVSASRVAVTGTAQGLAVLGAFVGGIVATTALLAYAAAAGWQGLRGREAAVTALTVLTAVASATVGGLLLFGHADALPALLGG